MTHTEQLAAVGHLDFDRDGVLNRFGNIKSAQDVDKFAEPGAVGTGWLLPSALNGALSGVSGIGHILLGTSMIALLVLVRRSAVKQKS